MTSTTGVRRYPIGAEPIPGGGATFRVWAPRRSRVEVVFEDRPEAIAALPLDLEEDGYFSGTFESVPEGARYRFRLDGGDSFPDPASRFQPEGPHGPSQLVDRSRYRWTDDAWRGLELPGQVLYEMHIGTFTPQGTWRAAAEYLPALADTGVTVLEIMPVAEFAGRFGWGYDGVDLFAPYHRYGAPDDFRAFVNYAHGLGLGVVLDVVYNHFGPAGNYLAEFTTDYFTERYPNEWGKAVNFDGPSSAPVREFVCTNAAYWIDEFHLDGLRLDATQQMFDESTEHIVAEITRTVRSAAAGRSTLVIAENEPQDVRIVADPRRGGYGVDGLWNDDFHHAATVALTGRSEAYYSDYAGSAQELLSAARRGFLYQGQRYAWQHQRRGTATFGTPRHAFVDYLENHDQVANSGRGLRMTALTSPGRYRTITALLLLGPGTPMLFQGQEFASSAPFLYFADHEPDLAEAVRKGRAEFLGQFPSLATAEAQALLADPGDPDTFERCILDQGERGRNQAAVSLHRDLLRLRRTDRVVALQGTRGLDGAVLAERVFVLRFFGGEGDDRLLIVNLGSTWEPRIVPEPLLAPPAGSVWSVLWSSEAAEYGGVGTPEVETEAGWRVPGEAAVLLAPERSWGSGGETGSARRRSR